MFTTKVPHGIFFVELEAVSTDLPDEARMCENGGRLGKRAKVVILDVREIWVMTVFDEEASQALTVGVCV